MIYHKINAPYKRWQKNLHTKEMLPKNTNFGDFKLGEFSSIEFDYLFNNQWEWSEKLDGTNIRIYIHSNKEVQPGVEANSIVIKGRTDNAQIPSELYEWIMNWYHTNSTELHSQFPEGVVLYGEGVGTKIQKGGLFGEQHFKLFDALIGEYWLNKDVIKALGKQFDLDTPQTWLGTMQEAIDRVKTKPKSTFGDFVIEGYVGVPICRLFNGKKERIITKIKVKDFQEMEKELK